MKVRVFATILALGFMTGCHQNVPVNSHVPLKGVEKKPPASNALVPVRDLRAQEQESIAKVDAKVASINKELAKTGTKLEEAVKEADRLRQQKKATEKELDDQWKLLTEVKSQSALAKVEAEEAAKELERRRALSIQLGNKIELLTKAVQEKDEEAASTRLILENSENLRKNSDLANTKLANENRQLVEDLNRALPYKHAVWWVVGLWIAFTIVKLILSYYGLRLPI